MFTERDLDNITFVWGGTIAAIAVSLSEFEQYVRIISLLLAIAYTATQLIKLLRNK